MAAPLIRMRLLGGDAVSAALLRMAQALPGATTQAAMAGAKLVEGFAKNEGFRTRGAVTGTKTTARGNTIKTYAAFGLAIAGKLTSRSGRLKSSIHHEEAGAGRAVVGPAVKYGAIHEFGGGRAQATTVRAHTRGGFTVRAHARKAYDMNMPARPYLRPALADHIPQVRAAMMKSIEKSLVRAKGIGTLGEAAK